MVNLLPPLAQEDKGTKSPITEQLGYLMRMVRSGIVSPDLACKAITVWTSIGEKLPVPAAAAFQGGPVEYHWAIGPHQLSTEIPATGLCHWTYRNKVTGELWGAETPEDAFPPELVEYLTRIAASNC